MVDAPDELVEHGVIEDHLHLVLLGYQKVGPGEVLVLGRVQSLQLSSPARCQCLMEPWSTVGLPLC